MRKRGMYYIFGDIHGCCDMLVSLYGTVERRIKDEDVIIFLGDYIDRGEHSYEVVQFLIEIGETRKNTVFLRGNHEAMFIEYLAGRDSAGIYLYNGGMVTKKSYRNNVGNLPLPGPHGDFYHTLSDFFEGDDFIAVHAGLRPGVAKLEAQDREDLVWIREDFFGSDWRWEKTVIFGHTPTNRLHRKWGDVYFDEKRNIIGIDTGAVYGGKLTCLVWPERKVLQA